MEVLFYQPHNMYWNQTLEFQNLIKNTNQNINILTCNGVLKNHCMVFNAKKLAINGDDLKKKKICAECISNKKIYKKFNKNIKFTDIDNLVSSTEHSEINRHLDKIDKNNYKKFEIDNIKLGIIATHDVILIQKLNNILSLEKNYWSEYISVLRSTLITFYGIKNFLKKNSIDKVITFNNLYCTNRVVAKFTEQKNIVNYNMSTGFAIANQSLQFLKLTEGVKAGFNFDCLKYWNEKNDKILLNNDFEKLIIDHYDSLFNARHYLNYSKPRNKRFIKKFINKEYDKTILIGLSGDDEDVCLEESGIDITYSNQYKRIFKNQMDWIDNLLEFIELDNNNLYIIRPHPRDWPDTQRSFVESDNYKNFKNYFENKDLPKNLIINSPTDNVSVYDFMEICDLLLVYRSSIAVDFGMMGIPVICSDLSLSLHPMYLDTLYKSKDQYFDLLKDKKNYVNNLNSAEHYIRWFIYSNILDTLDLRQTFKKSESKNIINTFYKIVVKILDKLNINQLKVNELKKIIENKSASNKFNKLLEGSHKSIVYTFVEDKNNYNIDLNLKRSNEMIKLIKKKFNITLSNDQK